MESAQEGLGLICRGASQASTSAGSHTTQAGGKGKTPREPVDPSQSTVILALLTISRNEFAKSTAGDEIVLVPFVQSLHKA
jgi:hypothetical protein